MIKREVNQNGQSPCTIPLFSAEISNSCSNKSNCKTSKDTLQEKKSRNKMSTLAIYEEHFSYVKVRNHRAKKKKGVNEDTFNFSN